MPSEARSSPLLAVAPAAALSALLLVALPACQRQVMQSSAVDQYGKPDDELDYLDAVGKMSAVTNNDALHGLLIFADGKDGSDDYGGRMGVASQRGWLPRGFSGAANESASVGWMAMAGCQICDVKGGLTMRVFGLSPRYCTRELIFMEVLPPRTENQSLTGAEFKDYLTRLQRIRSGSPAVPDATSVAPPPGEAASTPMNEGAVDEALPSPTPESAAPKRRGEPAPPTKSDAPASKESGASTGSTPAAGGSPG